MPLPDRKCPCCDGTDLQPGFLGTLRQAFLPRGSETRWDSAAFACLDCGFVSHFLGEVAINAMRKQAGQTSDVSSPKQD